MSDCSCKLSRKTTQNHRLEARQVDKNVQISAVFTKCLGQAEVKGQTAQPRRPAYFEVSPPFKNQWASQRGEAESWAGGGQQARQERTENTERNSCSLQTLTWWSSIWTCTPSPAAPSSCLPKRSGFPLSLSWSTSLQVNPDRYVEEMLESMQSWVVHVSVRVLGLKLTFCITIVHFELLEMHRELPGVCRVCRV